jgi:hypothetical protein
MTRSMLHAVVRTVARMREHGAGHNAHASPRALRHRHRCRRFTLAHGAVPCTRAAAPIAQGQRASCIAGARSSAVYGGAVRSQYICGVVGGTRS